MLRGPKGDPRRFRVLQGGKADETAAALDAMSALPVAPVKLNDLAQAEWDRVVPQLHATGYVADVDLATLAGYCMAYARWSQAEADIDRMATQDPSTHGALVKTTNGNLIQNPLVGVASNARKQMLQFAAEFGLTPASRTKSSRRGGSGEDALASKYDL